MIKRFFEVKACPTTIYVSISFFFIVCTQLEKVAKMLIAIGGVTAQIVINIMVFVKTWSKNR